MFSLVAPRLRSSALVLLTGLLTLALLLTGITPARAANGDATVTVRVLTSAGAPVAGLTVTANSRAAGAQQAAVTATAAGAGSYLLSGLTSGTPYAIGVQRPGATVPGGAVVVQYLGGGLTRDAATPFTPTAGANQLDFSLSAGVVSGKVLTSAGKALAGVDVRLYRSVGTSWTLVDATTSAAKTGAYAFTTLEPGRYTARFTTWRAARSYITTELGGAPALYDTAFTGTSFSVVPGKPAVITQKLAVGGTVTGTVRAGSVGVAGAKVIPVVYTRTAGVWEISGALTSRFAVTTAGGKFNVPGLPAGYYGFSIQSPGSEGSGDSLAEELTVAPVRVIAGKSAVASAALTALPAATRTLTGQLTPAPTTAGGTVEIGQSIDFERTKKTVAIQPNGSFSVQLAPGGYSWKAYPTNTAQPGTPYRVSWGTRTVTTAETQTPIAPAWEPDSPLAFKAGYPSLTQTATTVGSVISTSTALTTISNSRGTATVSVQWMRDGIPVFGATGPGYTSRGSDVGRSISARLSLVDQVTGARVGAVTSSVTITAGPAPTNNFVPTVTPSTGTIQPGVRLIASPGSWSNQPLTFSYQWMRAGVPITGATSAAYTLQGADAGASVAVRVVANKSGHPASAPALSAAVPVSYLAAPVLKKSPVVTAVTAGQPAGTTKYTVTAGTWAPATTVAIEWFADGASVGTGATVPYAGTAALTARITTTKVGSVAGVATVVARRGTVAPTVSGTPRVTNTTAGGAVTAETQNVAVGSVLGVSTATWTNPDAAFAPSYAYSWQRLVGTKWTPIAGASKSTYTVTTSDVGAKLRLVLAVVSARYPTVSVPLTAGTGFVRQELATATTTVSIGGAGVPLVAVTAAGMTWPVASVTQKYQWFSCAAACAAFPANYTAIAKATAASFVPPAALGTKSLVVRVTASKAGFAPKTIVSAPRVLGQARVITNLTPPGYGAGLVSGKATVGKAVTATAGMWNIPGVTVAYTWQKCSSACTVEANWTRVGGAAAYTTTAADFGAVAPSPTKLRVIATATKSGYNPTVTVAATQLAVGPGLEYLLAPPKITRVGNTFTAGPVAFGPANSATSSDVRYVWIAGDSCALDCADPRTFTMGPEHIGKPISLQLNRPSRLHAYDGGSVRILVLRGTPTVTSPTTISAARVGDWNYVTPPTVTWAGHFAENQKTAYQWFANGVAIKGATTSAYLPTAAISGKKLTVRTTITTSNYTTVVSTSAPSTVALGTATAWASITGAAKPGSTLGVSYSSSVTGQALSYQWQISTDFGATFASIPKATAKTFRLTNAHPQTVLRVVITARKAGYSTLTTVSNTQFVNAQTLPLVTPAALPASAALGATLTVTAPTYAIPGVAVSYRWLRNGSVVPGLVTPSIPTIVFAPGDNLAVEVSAKLVGYLPTTVTLDPIVLGIGAAPTATGVGLPKVTGTATSCATLTATPGVWSRDGLRFEYQWVASSSGPIAGATSRTYTLPEGAWVGERLSVVVTATRAGWATGTAQSLPSSVVTASTCG